MKLRLVAGAVIAAALFALPAAAQQQIDFSKAKVTTKDLGHGLHYLVSIEDNLMFLEGADSVLLIDTNYAQTIDKITAAIAKVTDRPVKYVINLHAHPDHLGGNEALGKAGALIIANPNLRTRMADGMPFFGQTIPPYPVAALPALTASDATFYFGGQTVRLISAPNAHTDSDTMVYFVEANVVHIGGVFGNSNGYPIADGGTGGSIGGIIEGQAKLLPLINNKTRLYADRGAAISKKDLQAGHDMLVTIRDRVQKLIDAGKTQDEVVAAKPTKDFDKRWAPAGSFPTGDYMAIQVYQSLKGVVPAPPSPATPK